MAPLKRGQGDSTTASETMTKPILALAFIIPIAMAAPLVTGCAQSRADAGKALIVSESALEATADAAAANAAAMTPAQRAKVKAAIDTADQAVIAAHAAYVAGEKKGN